MIHYINRKNFFDSKADALVNPVNCKGTMGKGIAKEFKERFPESFLPYKGACDTGKLKPGILLLVRSTGQPDLFMLKKPAVILFPTKKHWKDKSRLVWIKRGLIYLKKNYRQWGLKSIAMPQLGCGLGGLKWEQVKSLIEKFFKSEPVKVEIYLSAIHEYDEISADGVKS